MSEDMLNVMGSFSETALDCIEKQNEEIEQLKSVLDEIREQLKKIKPDLDFEPWSIYKVSGSKLFDLLQILDKVKE